MKREIKYKGFFKLSIQIAITSITMMVISLFTETDLWLEYFNTPAQGCNNGGFKNCSFELHYHWNYRGWVYSITGLVYFILTLIRIRLSHEDEDF